MPGKSKSIKALLEKPPKDFFNFLIVDDERVICEVLQDG